MKSMTIIDEKELLTQLRNGDQLAFKEIYRLYAAQIENKLHRLVKLDIVVEELLQDTFIRLWNTRSSLAEDTRLQAYLYTIGHNLTIDYYRRAAKDKALEKQLIEYLMEHYDHIEPLLETKETAHHVESLIAQLPEQRQKIFRMIRMEGKTYQETAIHFGITLNTVKDHMKKSSRFLKEKLAKDYPHIFLGLVVSYFFQ
ncbi:sigma-70 family RNA polymerase sigma factor [Chryseobacterium sp.]|uniref:RNA polymerase sigma factor n=1 Tax=Chryseobacterium sp. TaxID=1871047 RepID=UPI00333EDD83